VVAYVKLEWESHKKMSLCYGKNLKSEFILWIKYVSCENVQGSIILFCQSINITNKLLLWIW
jgi:hypothetical protein